MPQPRKATRFGGSPGHHNMMMSNLTTELIRHGRIRTTLARAKTVQPLAEKMITHAKKGDLHSRRQVLRVVRDKDVVHKLFAQVGPAFAGRDGGYTRVLKLGPRKGDAAPMALIELVEGVSVEGAGELEEAPRRRWALRRRKGGTVSSSAREREEERLAAVDRGEEPDVYDEPLASEEDVEDADHDEGAAAAVAGPDAGEREDAVEDAEAPQADPAEVEARLAAQEAEEASAGEGASDQDSGDGEDEDGPITDAPVPSEEQDAPSPETMPSGNEPDDDDRQ